MADERADYGILEARELLIEFVGGEPGNSFAISSFKIGFILPRKY